MAEDTKIQWCDHTFNPWRGCTRVSAGCANCYADAQSKRNPDLLGVWGPKGTRVVAAETQWRQVIRWDREAEATGQRRRVFCASMADVFEAWGGPMVTPKGLPYWWCGGSLLNSPIPSAGLPPDSRLATMDDFRERVFELILDTPHLDWLLLTKRPQNCRDMLPSRWYGNPQFAHRMPTNLWLGTTCENQAAADERIPHLLATPAAVRFLSCEPLLGPVDLLRAVGEPSGDDYGEVDARWQAAGETAPEEHVEECEAELDWINYGHDPVPNPEYAEYVRDREEAARYERLKRIDWVIVGGESGPGARYMDLEWARRLVRQCQAGNRAVFVKQLGARPIECQGNGACNVDPAPCREPPDGYCTLALKDKKGGTPDEWPEDLRVREFPVTGA